MMDPVEDREAPAGDKLRREGEVRKKAEDQAKVDTLRPAPEGDEREGPAPAATRPAMSTKMSIIQIRAMTSWMGDKPKGREKSPRKQVKSRKMMP